MLTFSHSSTGLRLKFFQRLRVFQLFLTCFWHRIQNCNQFYWIWSSFLATLMLIFEYLLQNSHQNKQLQCSLEFEMG